MYETDDDLLELMLIPRVGRARARSLYAAGFRSAADIAAADPGKIARIPGIGTDLARDIFTFCSAMAATSGEKEETEKQKGLFICPMCGSMVSEGSNVCSGCGITFSDDVEDLEPEETEAQAEVPKGGEDDGFWYRKRSSLFICPACGSLAADGSDTCPKCGVQFEEDGEEEEAELPKPAPGEADGYWYREDTTLFMCPNCGSFIKKDANSCGICGIVFEAGEEEEPVPEELTCPMCKSALAPSSKTCEGCGFDFTREKEKDGFWYKDTGGLFMCPSCGSFIPDSATQCGKCGTVLEQETEDEADIPEPPVCPMCKSALETGATSCRDCGFDFSLDKEIDGHWYKDSASLFICPGCGAFLSDAADRCLNCGLVFEGEDEVCSAEPITPAMETLQAQTPDSELEKQVDGLILEIGEELEAATKGPDDRETSELAELELLEPTEEIFPQDSLYICPVCGAFIQPNMLKCPSCSAVFDDIEDMQLEPVGSVQIADPLELAREMAAEIEEIEAELLQPPQSEKTKKGGVSKDFLDRWKKLEPGEVDTRKAGKSSDDISDIEKELEEITLTERAPVKMSDGDFWETRARDLASEGRLEEAVAFLDRAVESNPEMEMRYKRLMLEIMGVGPEERPVDLSEIAAIDEIGELSVDDALTAESDLRRLEDIDRELGRNPDNGSLWQEKGDILEKLGRHEEAVASFDRSISLSYAELRRDTGVAVSKRSAPLLGIGLTNGQGRVNGRVNGLLAQRGLLKGKPDGKVNGISKGKINGTDRGRINGLSRGRADGRVNGTERGIINGLSRGRTNGKVNGLTNGLAEGRVNGAGLINGTGAGFINGGLVNGLGLVNGEGMVNGTGNLRRMRQRRRERIMWRYRLTAMVLFVTMVLWISMVGNIIVQEDGGMLSIDGNFSDWTDVRGYYNSLEGAPEDPGLRITETRVFAERGKLGVYVALEGDAFTAQGGSVDSVWVFADLDSDAGTGYSLGGLGADLATEIYGWNGTVMGTSTMRFDSSAAGDDWAGFVRFTSPTAAVSGNEMEISISVPREAAPTVGQSRVLVFASDSDGESHSTGYVMVPDLDGGSAAFRQTGDEVIIPGTGRVALGEVALSAHSADGIRFRSLEFLVAGSALGTDLVSPALTLPGGEAANADMALEGGNLLRFTFRNPLDIPVNTTVTLTLESGISPQSVGETLGLRLSGVNATDALVRVSNVEIKMHNIGEPNAMAVDGAFGDWAGIAPNADPVGDVLSHSGNSPFTNNNLDILDSAFAVNSANTLFFRFSVDGVMMGGDEIPTLRLRTGENEPGPTYSDSDRDTVPDSLDPLPGDFNNDGTPDAEAVTPTGIRDVDGDGIADHPEGPDMWLNMTVPGHFPAPYAGTFVSLYIGPVSSSHTENLGDDRAYILIDSDGDPGTGQNLKGGIGIDHTAVISGKNNVILASELYRYEPGSSETGWVFVRNISAATDWTRMEGAIGLADLGMWEGDNYRVYISIEDWKGNSDVIDAPFTSDVPQAGGTRSPAGDSIVINEISGFGTAEWVELCNPTGSAMNISGWLIRIQTSGLGAYKTIGTVPAGTLIGDFGSGSEYATVTMTDQIPDKKWANVILVSGGATVDALRLPIPVSGTVHARLKNATWGMPQDTDGDGDWYSSAVPTRDGPNDRKAPLMTVTKTSETVNVAPGGTVTYTIMYQNTGEGNARNVWINDTLPSGMSYLSSSAPYTSSSGQIYTWHFTDVPPGSFSLTLIAQTDVSVPIGTVLTNSAQMDYTDQLSRPWGSSSDSWDVTVIAAQPIISLTKTANLVSTFPREIVTFTINYDNIGAGAAGHLWLNDTLPAGFTFVSAAPAPDYQSGQDIGWHLLNVGLGTHTVEIQAQVDIGVPVGATLTNTVTCDYTDLADVSFARETATASVTVASASMSIVINEIVSIPNPEWVELCNPSPENIDLGGWTIQYYQGRWKDASAFAAGTVLGAWGSGSEYLATNLPAGVLNDRGAEVRIINSGGQVVDSTAYPEIAAGQSWARLKNADTGKPDSGFYITNNNWLVPEGPTPGAPNDRKRPIMDIAKSATPTVAEPGQTVIFTITYTNTGDGNAKSVWVNDTLPAGFDFISASPSPASISGQDLVWFFSNVVSGTGGYIAITARMNSLPTDGEVLTNTATMIYHDALKRPMGTGTASASVTCSRPVIAVSKVADVTNAAPGGTVVYTIFFNNTGSATAGSVWINDTLPTGVTYSSSSIAPSAISGQDLSWLIADVAPGSHSLTVTVTVDSDAAGTLTNWAVLDYASRYAASLEQNADSAVVVIPEMRTLALPIIGLMFIGFTVLRRRRRDSGKKI